MLAKIKDQILESVSVQLLKVVFSFYLAVAVGVTALHMTAEYFNTQEEIKQEFSLLHETFEDGLAQALWNINQGQIQVILEGMIKLPSLQGILLEEGEDTFQVGFVKGPNGKSLHFTEVNILNTQDPPRARGLFHRKFPLVFKEKQETVGSMTLFSSNEVVWQKLRYGFAFILVNSLIKTTALWIIFILCARRILERPLSRLTNAAHELRMDNLENLTVHTGVKKTNELKYLEDAFNKMIQNLLDARESVRYMAHKKSELETAQMVQQLIIPRKMPQLPQIELSAFYQAADETGGDWFDFREHPNEQILDILLGDVTGHGIPAALVTAMNHGFCQARDMNRMDQEPFLQAPIEFMKLLNRYLRQTSGGDFTMTLFFARIDLSTRMLYWASAAHTPCMVWRPASPENGRMEEEIIMLRKKSYTMGAVDNADWVVQPLQLYPGDLLILFTDGLIENENPGGTPFGQRQLRKTLTELEGLTAERIRDRMMDRAQNHFLDNAWADDITLIVGRLL